MIHLDRLSMNWFSVSKKYHILRSGTATIRQLDSCRPRRQVHGHTVESY